MQRKRNYILLMLMSLILTNCATILDNSIILNNTVVLHEKSGSRELLNGRQYRDSAKNDAAIKAFRLAMHSEYTDIKTEATRELARLLYAKRGDYDFEIVTLLKQASTLNKAGDDKIATTMLADYHAKQGNPELAIKLLEKVASQHLPAKVALYGLYEKRGDAMQAKFAELLNEYQVANNPQWHLNMAKLYNRKDMDFYDAKAALKYYKLDGTERTYIKVAKILRFDAANQNLAEAAKYYEKAADAGNFKAVQALNDAYSQGGWLQPDATKQRIWLEKMAEAGDVKASTELGLMAARAGNAKVATKFFAPAIAQDFNAKYEIAKKLNGNPLAKIYAAQALQSGDTRALSLLRKYYLGTWQNAKQTLVAESFLQQNPSLITTALARRMAKSWKRYGQEAKAMAWLLKCANMGDVAAQKQLAQNYMVGENVEQDLAAAHNMYEKAANAGDAQAQYQLGLLYARGLGCAKNEKLARKWLRKSGKAGAENMISD